VVHYKGVATQIALCFTLHLDFVIPSPYILPLSPPFFSKMPLNSKAVYAKSDAALTPFASRRSTVHSRNGIISCTQPLAAAAGHKILTQGGNAAVRRFSLY
jgi:hypothetical protein